MCSISLFYNESIIPYDNYDYKSLIDGSMMIHLSIPKHYCKPNSKFTITVVAFSTPILPTFHTIFLAV